MSGAPSMIWHEFGRNRLVSACGRYEIQRATSGDGRLVLCVLFYGFIAYRVMIEADDEVRLGTLQRWCESHRQRVLPRIQHFEMWAAVRYNSDVYGLGTGPTGRRNLVQKLIHDAGDGALELNWSEGRRTIAERFAELYQSIDPDHDEARRAPAGSVA